MYLYLADAAMTDAYHLSLIKCFQNAHKKFLGDVGFAAETVHLDYFLLFFFHLLLADWITIK